MGKKPGQKIQKKLNAGFQIFRLWPLHSTGIMIGPQWPYHVLKHAEMRSETRGVQDFGATSGISASKRHASGRIFAKNQSFRNKIESPDCFLYESFVRLE